jgi:hypothetical protein
MKLQVHMQVSDITEYFAQTSAVIKLLHDTWKALMAIDSSHTNIEPWSTVSGKIPPLGSSSSFPSSKARLAGKYLEDVKLAWASWTKLTTFQFILGHTKPISDYLDSNTSLIRKLDSLGSHYSEGKK